VILTNNLDNLSELAPLEETFERACNYLVNNESDRNMDIEEFALFFDFGLLPGKVI
jgi:hypothetical protein